MSVCKGGVGSSTKPAAWSHESRGSAKKNSNSSSSSSLSGERQGEGKENASSGNRLHMFSDPSPTKATGGRSKSKSGGVGKEDGKSDATAFDLMPPPLPRTPGKEKGGPSRSSVLSPLGRHDPNSGDGKSGGAVGRGRAPEKVGVMGNASPSVSFPCASLCVQYLGCIIVNS